MMHASELKDRNWLRKAMSNNIYDENVFLFLHLYLGEKEGKRNIQRKTINIQAQTSGSSRHYDLAANDNISTRYHKNDEI